MTKPPNRDFPCSLQRFAGVVGVVTFAIGLLVFLEWTLGVKVLSNLVGKNGLPRPSTALGFILAGFALWLLREEVPDKRNRHAAQVCAIIAAALGLLGLMQYIVSWEVGPYDLFLWKVISVSGPDVSLRMAFNSGISLVLIGGSLLFLDTKVSRNYWLGEWLVWLAVLVNLDAAVGEALNPFTPMVELTNATFLLLCLGIQSARPNHGVMGILTSQGPGGYLARRLLPFAILLPLLLSKVILASVHARGFEIDFAFSLLTLSILVPLAAAVLWHASFQNRADEERKRAEEALRETEEQLRLFVEYAPAAIAMLDCNMNYVAASHRWFSDYGIEDRNIVGRNHYEVFPDIPERWKEIHRRCLSGAVERNEADPWVRLDGRTDWVRWEIRPWRKSDDVIGGLIIFSEVITERKRTEEALRETSLKLETLFKASPLAIILIGLDERVQLWNPAAERLFGWTEQEVLGRPNPIIPEDKKEEYRALRQVVLEGKPLYGFETKRLRKDGTLVDVNVARARMYDERGKSVATIGMLIDISERKRAEEEKDRLVAMLEASPDFVAIADAAGNRLYMNSGGRKMVGISEQEDILGQRIGDRSPEWAKSLAMEEGIPAAIRDGAWSGETAFLGPDGREIPMIQVIVAHKAPDGTLQFLSTIAHDISNRKQAEERIRESNRRLAALVNASPLAIISTDLDGIVQAWNHAAEQMYGWSEQEVIGRPVPIVPEDERQQYRDALNLISQGVSQHGMEGRPQRKDGSRLDVRFFLDPLYDTAGKVTGNMAISEDITERKALQAQLFQAQKMEAVGQLAGGVAHDFNNLLNVILGYSDLLLERADPSDPMHKRIVQIKKSAERGATLTRQLLAFSRKQVLQPKILDINTLVVEEEQMLSRLLGEHIELTTHLEPSLGQVKADPGQMEQILMNLAVNSRDAMPDGGRLIIETENVELDEAYTNQHLGARPGSFVMLKVSDTGIGIDPETQAHIFEPFFTTKEPGKGTGLGLSTVYGIVKQSEGFIWVYSEPGMGTTFKIYLPRVDAVAEAPSEEKAAARTAQSQATVLIVEDEESLRELAREFLESAGYKVLMAKNGPEALQIAAQHPGPIEILVTDVVMPGMSGREVARRLASFRPAMKVLYVSGYTNNAIAHHGVLDPRVAFLEKPFTKNDLLSKVRELLEA